MLNRLRQAMSGDKQDDAGRRAGDNAEEDGAPSLEEIGGKMKNGLEKIDEDLSQIDLLNQASEKTGIKRLYLSTGILFLILFALFTGFGAGFIVNLVGFAYPAFMSFKALDTKDRNDDSQWLTYWICFAFLNLFETVGGLVLSFIPFYNGLKCIFLFYLFLPQTKGADFVYHQFVEGFFKKHESTFSHHISQFSEGGSRVASTVREVAEEKITRSALSSGAPQPEYCDSEDDDDHADKKDK
eukprot:gb/GECG01016035.1/.p1 GENE.gb/GECG01016035.1/~~gb/GECG01016035.1/.p1  ORF type:complete len:241 (+),score=32.77 gb/GECG01016035.1/:1-723(+)